jgi:hypothetical protein
MFEMLEFDALIAAANARFCCRIKDSGNLAREPAAGSENVLCDLLLSKVRRLAQRQNALEGCE